MAKFDNSKFSDLLKTEWTPPRTLSTKLNLQNYMQKFEGDRVMLEILNATPSIQKLALKHGAFDSCFTQTEKSMVVSYFRGLLILDQRNLTSLKKRLKTLLSSFKTNGIRVDESVKQLMTYMIPDEKPKKDVLKPDFDVVTAMSKLKMEEGGAKSENGEEEQPGEQQENPHEEPPHTNCQVFLGITIKNGNLEASASTDIKIKTDNTRGKTAKNRRKKKNSTGIPRRNGSPKKFQM